MIEFVFEDGDSLTVLRADASPEQRHGFTSTVTAHEVERGVDVTDHVKPERRPFTAECVFGGTSARDGASDPDRARDAWATLLDARDRALLTIITTPLETLEDMVLVDAQTTRTNKDGSWIRVELTFASMRMVASELVDDPIPARARDRAQTDLGTQATQPTELRSVLSRLPDAVAGLFAGGS
jgi:hypothetical protein